MADVYRSGSATTRIIRPISGWFDFDLRELWDYRDLIMLFVRRDFVSVYKQTLLGPLWYVVQPALTTFAFLFVFSGVAKIPTDGTPAPLFYLSGLCAWNYFAGSMNRTSNTLGANTALFGKVYFPRLVVPISVLISGLIAFLIQLVLLIAVTATYTLRGAAVRSEPLLALFVVPCVVIQMATLALGLGMMISALTVKYRDLSFLVGFGIQLWMYVTPVIYPISEVPQRWRPLIALNPMSPPIELLRYAFVGGRVCTVESAVLSATVTAVVLVVGLLLFGRAQKTFMDTI